MAEIQKIRLNTRDVESVDGRRWWRAETDDEAAAGVEAMAKRLKQDDGTRSRAALLHARLYQNTQLDSLHRFNLARTTTPGRAQGDSGLGHRVSFNVVKSCIDTACAKTSKNRPRVSFVTSRGNHETKRRARDLSRYVDGLFAQADLYSKTDRAFRDACVFGTGVVKVSVDAKTGTFYADRVLPFELFADPGESIHGSPRSLYQESPRHRDEILAEFGDTPEKITAIMGANSLSEFRVSGIGSDMIPVYEAWHLPSGDNAKDGRHVISVGGVSMWSEEWTWDWFPLFLYHWSDPLVGLWGQGISEELTGIQLEISKTLRTIQRAQHLAGGLRVFKEKNAEINTAHINNEIGEVITFRGTPPLFDTVSRTVPPELFSHLENLVRKAYELTGISQLSANAKKPPGVDAAVAIREMYDIESERFVKNGQRWEKFHVDIARAMVQMSAALYERRPGLKVAAPGTKFLEVIEWSKVRLKEDQYDLRAFPTSSLPTTPAYRFQYVTEMKKAGVIDQEQMMQLLDMPDLEQFVSLYTASINDIERCLDAIVERGEYLPPEPFMDLKRAVKMSLSALLKAREDGVPERRQELLLRWMDEAKSLQDGAQPTVGGNADKAAALAGSAPADPMQGPAGGAPMLPPTSNIPALPTATAAVPPPVSGMPPAPVV